MLFFPRKRSQGGSVYWHCRCDCGKEVDVNEGALVSGGWKSCGCLKKEIQDNLCKSVQIIDHTAVEWLENRKHRRDNTTGFRGVYRTRNDRYYAAIGFKQRSYYLGRYDTLEEAIAVRLDAEHLVHDGFVAAYRAWQHKVEIDPAYAADHPFIFDVQRIDGALQVTTSEPEVWQNRKALVMIDKPEPVPVSMSKSLPKIDAYQKRKTGFDTHFSGVSKGIVFGTHHAKEKQQT